MYEIILRNNAKKFLQKLSKDTYLRIKKLRGDLPGAYRLRVGKWRVLFTRNDDARRIDIVMIEKRGDIY